MGNQKIIGIVGGMGPFAGLDLMQKILDQTQATCDQNHLSSALLSFPSAIADRSLFLLGQKGPNPAFAILSIIRTLDGMGVSVIGIPCNTAHSPPIFDVISQELKNSRSKVRLIHMIDETVKFIKEQHPHFRRIGVLSTQGTFRAKVYGSVLKKNGFKVILLSETDQDTVHKAIYDQADGIKAQANPVSKVARRILLKAIHNLQKNGAQAVILGCSEIPLAVKERAVGGTVIVDPTRILARALIRAVAPDRLKPL